MLETSPALAATEPQTRLLEAQIELELLREKRTVHELAIAEAEIERQKYLAKLDNWDRAFPNVAESWSLNGQQIMDVTDFLPRGWNYSGAPIVGSGNLAREATVSEVMDGSFLPMYSSEQDLSRYRALAQLVVNTDCVGSGILQNLVNYTVGKGFTFTAGTKVKTTTVPPGLVDDVSEWLAAFLDANDFTELTKELAGRAITDGEFLKRFTTDRSGMARLGVVEPLQITDCGEWPEVEAKFPYVTSWTYGVHSAAHDPSLVHGFAVQHADGHYEYLPVSRAEFHKSNVPRRAKRGLSDFAPAYRWLQSQARLLANTSEGAAELAAVSYIISYCEGVSQSSAYSMRSGLADISYTINTPNGSKTVNKEYKPAGSILNVPKGQQYEAGPAGAERGISFIQIAAAILRQLAVRWSMTEGQISGDDSSNNRASSETAGTRWHRSISVRQSVLSARLLRIIWKALRFAFNANRFARYGIFDWYTFQRLIEITADGIDADELNKIEQERVYQMRLQAGVMSVETYRSKVGLDHAQEEERLSRQVPNEFRQPYMT